MKIKLLFVISVSILILGNTFSTATSVKFHKEKNKEEFFELAEEELIRLNDFLDKIKNEEKKIKIEEILNKIIIQNKKVDIKAVEELSKKYYNSINSKIAPIYYFSYSPNLQPNLNINDQTLSLGLSSGTSTVFMPPYDGCFSWGDGTNLIDEYSHGCNKHSGAIGVYANAFIGGATAEAMQQVNFYVGRTKTISINAKILRSGGKTSFGFGAFSGTEKTWTWEEFNDNYHRSDVDSWLSWDVILFKIISIVTLIIGVNPTDIAQAISLVGQIFDFDALAIQMYDMFDEGNAKVLNIKFSYSAKPGYHTIWTGLRASASACLTGTASAVTMGQVEKITIDGIAVPDSPDVSGPSSCLIGEIYEFCAESGDPNGDKIRYLFDWGDGTNSGWTNYKTSGSKVCKTKKYTSEGTYDIKVYSQDIDKMQSESTYTVIVGGQKPPNKPSLSGSSTGQYLEDYTLKVSSIDPNKDTIIYFVDWGDEKTNEYGPYESGKEKSFKHEYLRKGEYDIKVKATDGISGWSEWATKTVSMPRDKISKNNRMLQLFCRFTVFTKILNNLKFFYF